VSLLCSERIRSLARGRLNLLAALNHAIQHALECFLPKSDGADRS
jgi:hypothetical protein